MNRRNFLRAFATVAGGAILLPSTRLILEHEAPMAGEALLAYVRETVGADIVSGYILTRHDVWACDANSHEITQLGVAGEFLEEQFESGIEAHRKLVAQLLADELQHRGFTVADLARPPEYKHGDVIRIRMPEWWREAAA